MKTQQTLLPVLCGVMLLMCVALVPAPAYMKLGDIKGESSDKDHKEWINIESLQWGVNHSSRGSTGGGGGAGKVNYADITVVKELDKSTPKLIEALVKSENLRNMTLDLTRKGEREPYLRYDLENVQITS